MDYLFKRYKQDKEFGAFLRDSGLIELILRRKNINSISKEGINTTAVKSIKTKNSSFKAVKETTKFEISNSDGFSKIIFEDLKIKRALSEHIVSQEHLLSQNDIRESFSYLAKNFNNVQLHQGEIWVIEYMGGL